VKKIIKELEAIFNRSGLTTNIEIKESNIMLGLDGGDDLADPFDKLIFFNICSV
jgi:hypothetical protein